MSKNGTKPEGSKYALKIRKRARAAKALGLRSNTPFPVIWAEQEEVKQ